MPLVTIAHLNLGVRRLTLSDASLPQPIVVSDLSLTNIDRIEWLGKDPAGKAPTHLRLTCRIDPVMDQLTLDALVAPFAQQPSLQLDVLATGVRGDGLTALAPALKANVDGSQLTDGRLAAHFETAVKLERRSPLEFDLSRGCDVDLLLKNVEYRAMDKGPVLAGLEELRADAVRIEPANSLVHARTLEITKPIGFVTQDEAGIRALGWLIKLPANVAATQPVTVATDAVATEPATAPAPAVAVATKPWAGDVRIDQLLISGLDARFEDHSCDPPLVVPLNGLDVEVRDVSTRSLHEPGRPIRFNAIVNGGKVRLPKRGQSKVKSAEQQYEQRELFSQITVNGSLTLYPQMTGWAKTSVSGLELTALAGPAKRQNVTLRNGTYDSTFEARMKSDGVIETNARLIFTDLSVSEPADGPIAKLLKLPGGLDGVVQAIQAADGSITLPVGVPLRQGHVAMGDVVGTAAGAVSSVILTAVASSPLKAVNAVGALVGLPQEKRPAAAEPIAVQFTAGAVDVNQAQLQALQPVFTRMKNNSSLTLTVRHELGGGDVQRAAERANPSPEDCRNLEYQLRTRKAVLQRLRADVAGQARGQLVSLGESGAATALARLRAIDKELGRTENALDEVCELLRPGADRQAARRTRQASLAIARERVDAVKAMLLASGVKDIADRVQVVEAQFNPTESDTGGRVLIAAVEKK